VDFLRQFLEKGDTLPKILKHNARALGEALAIVEKRHGTWVSIDWHKYFNRVKEIAYGLLSLGLRKRDVVIIIGDSSSEWYFIELAIHSLGAVSLGMSPESKGSKLASITKKFDVRFIFAQDQEQVDKILKLKDDFRSLERIVYWRYRGLGRSSDTRLLGIKELVEMGRQKEIDDPDLIDNIIEDIDPDDPCTLVFTSGISGEPKAVLHSHRSILENVRRYLEVDTWKKTDRILPFFSPFGLVDKWFCLGCHLLSAATLYIGEDPRTYVEDMRESKPTVVFFPGYVWEKMVTRIEQRIRYSDPIKRFVYKSFTREKNEKKRSLLSNALEFLGYFLLYRPLKKYLGLLDARLCYNLGPVLSRKVFDFYHCIGVPLKNLYWTSETGFISVQRVIEAKPGSMGLPFRDIRVGITEKQELEVSGGYSFGTYADKQISIEGLGTKITFRTGDLGVVKLDGEIVVMGRREDFPINFHQEKFSTQVLESLLRLSATIKDAWVFGGGQGKPLAAIIIIDEDNVRKVMGEKGIHYFDSSELSQKEEVLDLVSEVLCSINNGVPPEVRILRYLVLPERFWVEDETVSFTRRLRKGYLLNVYREVIEGILKGLEKITIPLPGQSKKEEIDVRIMSLEGEEK
jgi:long-chain acyl-CoA synthetase